MFKVGDKVRRINDVAGDYPVGIEAYVVEVYGGGYIRTDYNNSKYKSENFELVTNNTTMNLTEKFTQLFMSEPEKSFRKAGIIDGDNLLTSEGTKIFLTWMLQKHKDEFQKEVVSELLKEDKK